MAKITAKRAERIKNVVNAKLDLAWRMYHTYKEENNEARAEKLLDEASAYQSIMWLFEDEDFLRDMEGIYGLTD